MYTIMSDDPISNVVEIIDSAHSQRLQLQELITTLSEAKIQVTSSAGNSRQKLKTHYAELKTCISDVLDGRLGELLSEVDEYEQSALAPLQQCGDILQHGINIAEQLLTEGKNLLSDNPEDRTNILRQYCEQPETHTLNSLPEVPCLSDVAFISVSLSSSNINPLLENIRQDGRVLGVPPVYITDVIERPGALLLKWTETEDEVEITEFCLQFSYGSIKSNDDSTANFHTAYTGPDNVCTIKHLRRGTTYSFRVSGRADRTKSWAVWSVPHIACTSIPHYQWSNDSENFSMSNENKTATRTGANLDEAQVLFSSEKSYVCGQPITFRVLDMNDMGVFDGIGLTTTKEDTPSFERPGALFVSAKGSVYIDGQKMKTQLPPLAKGSSLTFDTDVLQNNKVRVSAVVGQKEVTFDWKLDEGAREKVSLLSAMNAQPGQENVHIKLYFALVFSKEDWKISVE